jgi:hypothetical protein
VAGHRTRVRERRSAASHERAISGPLRDECLTVHQFTSIEDPKATIAACEPRLPGCGLLALWLLVKAVDGQEWKKTVPAGEATWEVRTGALRVRAR